MLILPGCVKARNSKGMISRAVLILFCFAVVRGIKPRALNIEQACKLPLSHTAGPPRFFFFASKPICITGISSSTSLADGLLEPLGVGPRDGSSFHWHWEVTADVCWNRVQKSGQDGREGSNCTARGKG